LSSDVCTTVSNSRPIRTAAVVDPPPLPVTPKWMAVMSLSLGVFGLLTAEYLPASLLTPIADDWVCRKHWWAKQSPSQLEQQSSLDY
jgi:hypothetical protein